MKIFCIHHVLHSISINYFQQLIFNASTTVNISSKWGLLSASYDQHFNIKRYISCGVFSGAGIR